MPGRCHGIQPKQEPGGGTAPATAGAAAGEPTGRGPGLRDEARLWSDRETVAALEFSQPPPSSKGTGTWRPKGGGPELRAEDQGGATALIPPGRQSFRKRPEDPPPSASKGWSDPAQPAGATTRGTTLLEGRGKSGAQLVAFFAKDKVGLARGALPAGEAVPADGRPQFFLGHRAGPATPPSPGPGRPAGGARGQRPDAEGKGEPLLPARQQEGGGGSPPTAG